MNFTQFFNSRLAKVTVTLFISVANSKGAVAGAWETFFNQKNTDAWIAFDYADGKDYFPSWSGSPLNQEYAYFTFAGDNSFSFIAEQTVGTNDFTGNYTSKKISGITCDVFIGSLPALEYMDCALLASGPNGITYYYSTAYYADEFTSGGWWTLNYHFDRSWYYLSGTDWVAVDPKSLTGIEQVIFNFVPKLNSAGGSRIGLDNVTLEPTVVGPQIATSVTNGTPRKLRLEFTPGPGLEGRIEKLRNPVSLGWATVIGETGIKGPSSHVFLTPATSGVGIFRVAVEPFYTPVITP